MLGQACRKCWKQRGTLPLRLLLLSKLCSCYISCLFCLPADADAAAAGAEPRSIAGTDFRCRGVSWGTGASGRFGLPHVHAGAKSSEALVHGACMFRVRLPLCVAALQVHSCCCARRLLPTTLTIHVHLQAPLRSCMRRSGRHGAASQPSSRQMSQTRPKRWALTIVV